MANQPVQATYNINPDHGFPGDIARPSEPHALDSGYLHVPSAATRNPRPGDAVYWNATENQFAVPVSAATQLLVCGILSYRRDTVAKADATLEFADNSFVEIGVFGTFWVRAGGAVEYRSLLQWQTNDFKWNALTKPAAFANLVETPIYCVSRVGADTGIIEARVGYGRVN